MFFSAGRLNDHFQKLALLLGHAVNPAVPIQNFGISMIVKEVKWRHELSDVSLFNISF